MGTAIDLTGTPKLITNNNSYINSNIETIDNNCQDKSLLDTIC
jgi:hypothetical protein